jgi:hypothetical protein
MMGILVHAHGYGKHEEIKGSDDSLSTPPLARPGESPSEIPSGAMSQSRSFGQFQRGARFAPRWFPASMARLPMVGREAQLIEVAQHTDEVRK